jgi:hypothetical protein
MFEAAPSWRVVIVRAMRVVQGVEHRRIAFAGHTVDGIDAIAHERVTRMRPPLRGWAISDMSSGSLLQGVARTEPLGRTRFRNA